MYLINERKKCRNTFIEITTDLDNQETRETVDKANSEEMINTLNENDFDIVYFQEYPSYMDGIETVSGQITERTHLKQFIICSIKALLR